jgi:hypothetical protein
MSSNFETNRLIKRLESRLLNKTCINYHVDHVCSDTYANGLVKSVTTLDGNGVPTDVKFYDPVTNTELTLVQVGNVVNCP